METKLTIDGLALGGPKEHFAYVQSRLGGTAAQTVLAFIQNARATNTVTSANFLSYMENVYGDANLAERASNRLNMMSQGKEAFTTFLPKFERALAEAGGSDWADLAKINTLKRMLNLELRKLLIYVPVHPTDYNDFVRVLQTLSSRLVTLNPRANITTTPATKPQADEMDWQPAANKASTPTGNRNEQRRAQWVSKDTLEKRRNGNLCLRCGGKGHFIGSCKLLPARSPQQDQARVKVMDVQDDGAMIVEVSDSDSGTESGKE